VGTAAVVSPVGELTYKGENIAINQGKIGELTQKLYDTLTGIQYGSNTDKHGWVIKV
jgi:branched-chain amino acid aminotransferase